MTETTFVPPVDVVTNYEAEKEKRAAEYAEENRLKEGTYQGRVTKIGEELSRAKNPMFVMILSCTGNKGKKVEEKKIFVKHLDFHMAEFYGILKMAGFNLKDITSEEKLGDALNTFIEDFPKCEFICTHQKDSNYNNYEITSIENVGGAAKKEAPAAEAEPVAEATPAATTTKKADPAPAAKVSTYTEEEILTFDKDDCLDVAEELGIKLKARVKGKMQKEIIAFISKPVAEAAPAEAKPEAKEAPGETEASIFPDQD